MTTKPRKITMTRTPHGYDTFGPELEDGRPRFLVYKPADAGDPTDTPFALLDCGAMHHPGTIGDFTPATVVLKSHMFVGRRTYWETKREIREAYSTVEAQQDAGILPPAAPPTDAPARYRDRSKATRKAEALTAISGQRFTVIGDGPGDNDYGRETAMSDERCPKCGDELRDYGGGVLIGKICRTQIIEGNGAVFTESIPCLRRQLEQRDKQLAESVRQVDMRDEALDVMQDDLNVTTAQRDSAMGQLAQRDEIIEGVRELTTKAYTGGGLPLTHCDGGRWMQWADAFKRGLDALLAGGLE